MVTFEGGLNDKLYERLYERLHEMICNRLGEMLDIACFKHALGQLGEWMV